MSEQPNAAPQEDGVFSADDTALLNETKQLRMTLIRSLAGEGHVPINKSDKIMLTQLLNDVDGQIVSRARTKIAAKTEENNGNITAMIAQALMKHRVGSAVPAAERVLDLPKEISAGEIVPGEMDQGVRNVTMADLGL